MNVLVVSSSPNKEGLTAACVESAVAGLQRAGQQVEALSLNDYEVCVCQACDDGWGSCLSEQRCSQNDAFPELHARFLQADAYVFVTPVYWGEPSESMKAFLDKLRRCEHRRSGRESRLAGKKLLLVAAAGGGGGGIVSCLEVLGRWSDHVGTRVFDMIGITRFNRSYKVAQIGEAAAALAAWVPEK
ncbi:MAG: flavodoxin family protein [Anaerolineae bacterium]